MTSVGRIPLLDGWRAISILLVLAGHLFWLGPSWLRLNDVAGASGMAIFFTLSGFLIVSFLHAGAPVGQFLVRRLARIVPLAWTAIAALVLWQGADLVTVARNLLFVANVPPTSLLPHGEHLWSLGVEMQFYAVAAVLAWAAGRRGMLAVPLLCVAVTIARIAAHEPISIVTWHRVDEILAGGSLALLYAYDRHRALRRIPLWLGVVVLIACSHPSAGPIQYLRPYAAAMLVGITLVSSPKWVERFLLSRPMSYIAGISYALYVIHAILAGTWLGTGETTEKYLKRPLLLAATFGLAHVSTRFLERPFTRWARRSRKIVATQDQAIEQVLGPPSGALPERTGSADLRSSPVTRRTDIVPDK